MSKVNEIKDKIQQEALNTHKNSNGFSTLAMCTGSGKSRCGILRAREVVDKNPNARILLACFTSDQRDNVWRLEFDEWGESDIYNNNVVIRVCYKSLHTIVQDKFDLVICDEFHHITEACISFFELNEINSIIGLTATPPEDKIKKEIINTIAPISFIYPVQQGIKDGVVAPFEISVIYTNLENKIRTVKGGSKSKPFMQTEESAYQFWDSVFIQRGEELRDFIQKKLWPLGWSESKEYYNSKKVEENKPEVDKLLKRKSWLESKFMMAMSKRSNIIYNSYNKTRIAKRLVNEFCETDYRYLFFAGSIEQSEEILPNQTYNSKTNNEAYNKFINLESNLLCAVRGLNEGTNIKELDYGIIVQLNSKELDMIQRIGRVIRIRPNHIGKMIIICLKGTRDVEWMKKVIKKLAKFIAIKEYSESEFFESIKQKELFN